MSKSKALLLLFSLFLSLYFFAIHGFSFNLADEFFILHPAQRLLAGEVPYKDFVISYNPGSVFATAIAFKLLGQSILAGRLMMLLFSFATTILLFKLTRSLLVCLIFIVWGPMQINIVSPTLLATFTGVLTLYWLFNCSKKTILKICLAAVATFLTFLFKQNLAVALIIVSTVIFLTRSEIRSVKLYLIYLSAILACSAFFTLYMLKTDSLLPFLNNLYYFSFVKLVIEGIDRTPLLLSGGFKIQIRNLLYLFVPLISLLAILLRLKKRRTLLAFPVFSFLYYSFGIRPVADFVHLVPTLALSGLPLFALWQNSRKISVRLLTKATALFLVLAGIHTLIFRGYYRWTEPIPRHQYFLNISQVLVYGDKNSALMVPNFIKFVDENSKKDSYIFVNHYAPWVYFLTGRKNPTRFEYITKSALYPWERQQVIEVLRKKRPELVFTHKDHLGDKGIEKFIQENYVPKQTIVNYVAWKIR